MIVVVFRFNVSFTIITTSFDVILPTAFVDCSIFSHFSTKAGALATSILSFVSLAAFVPEWSLERKILEERLKVTDVVFWKRTVFRENFMVFLCDWVQFSAFFCNFWWRRVLVGSRSDLLYFGLIVDFDCKFIHKFDYR